MKTRRPPLRQCVDCRAPCYGWSASSRCRACAAKQRGLGTLGLEPAGAAAEARARRLQRFAATEAKLGRD